MKKSALTALIIFISSQAFAQHQRKISTYVFAQYSKTIYDITLGNNPSGIGLGVQTFFNNQTKFKPAIEITRDIYLENDKVLRMTSADKPIADVRGMTNIFIGSLFQPAENIYVSFLGGTNFINGQTFLGIKPSFGFYFSKNQKWSGKVSFVNIFNRDKTTKDDFGSLVFALGLKLF